MRLAGNQRAAAELPVIARQRACAPDDPVAALVEMADDAGVDVIATDVQSEEDAVSLIDMGIDLMTGERLSAPRRLKADGPGGAKRA